eukprot:5052134-Pyramimonas_sp.AAC.1
MGPRNVSGAKNVQPQMRVQPGVKVPGGTRCATPGDPPEKLYVQPRVKVPSYVEKQRMKYVQPRMQ